MLTPEKWQNAQGLCEEQGGFLATLNTLEEIIWIRGYRSYHTVLQGDSWIGGKLKDGKWI